MAENKCGDRIRQRLIELNLTQSELCKKTGINKSTMSQYISGKFYPTQDRLDKICDALKATPAYMMGWTDANYYGDSAAASSIGQLMNIAKDLSDEQIQQLITYAKFLSKEEAQ